MSQSNVGRYAQSFFNIFQKRERVPGPDRIDALTLAEAYAVQDGFVAARTKVSGPTIGWKVGCTSAAIRQQFGLSQPISGRLFERELHADHAELHADDYVDCAIEPELIFTMGQDLHHGASDAQIVAAIASVAPGIELHNYRFWYGTPTSQELIASNGIHAGLIRGRPVVLPPGFDLNREKVHVLKNDHVEASGVCSEIMGGPVQSMRWLLSHLKERGQHLRAGELVIPGSAVKLVRICVGDLMEARFETLGSCHARLIS